MLKKMGRRAFKTNNVDNCARACHGPGVFALATTLGTGAMTNLISVIANDADAILLVGSNPEEAHLVIGMQIHWAVRCGGKLIVIMSRDFSLPKSIDIHLMPRPGTNVTFANGMMHIVLRDGLLDEKFIIERTENFEALSKIFVKYTAESVAKVCEVQVEIIEEAAYIYVKAKAVPSIYCLCVTHYLIGTEGVILVSTLAILCGKLGRPGCCINPILGQNNAQGVCVMGASPCLYIGYQNFTDIKIRAKFEKAWCFELSDTVGAFANERYKKMFGGLIKGLAIFREDPVCNDSNYTHIDKALKTLKFFVVVDLFLTVSAKHADLLLLGCSYTEKEGTFSNTECRVQRVRKVVEIEGDAKHITLIFSEIMNRMRYAQEQKIFLKIIYEIASLTQPFGGISHERLDRRDVAGHGIQWPCASKDHPSTYIMLIRKFTRELGLFRRCEYKERIRMLDKKFSVIIVTGRILNHYNSSTMIDKSLGINHIAPESLVEVNMSDAAKIGLSNGNMAKVISRRCEVLVRARVSDNINPGQCWMSFLFLDGNARILTIYLLNEICLTLEYKVCAVRIEK
ncbi:MAG: molybdopterin-dependent oxidoreductase [Eggerthellaceae bacterium]|nr:molybdopterin-dependent oxidoreductase [Eggerthellaceae bacterium]